VETLPHLQAVIPKVKPLLATLEKIAETDPLAGIPFAP
jgi:quinol monooxygenase YgiN